ncbi:MAG: DinB family protein [Propionibacteriaceae bacterium]|nr:DinB family protein [Propionibacteriaceae bacterium]
MRAADVLIDAYGRVHENVDRVLDQVTPQVLKARVDPDANTIAWLIWHMTRVQDDHMASAFSTEQVWTSQGWFDKFALPYGVAEHGYGHTTQQVGECDKLSADLLRGYHEATWKKTVELLGAVSDEDLDRVVDTRWTPPVTLAVRLVSVLNDSFQHVGQAAFVRGVVERVS